MGENKMSRFQLSFNALAEVDFQGSRVTSDGGRHFGCASWNERLGLGGLIPST